MKKVCVLLNGDIKNDSRVIRVINTLSSMCLVDLYYIGSKHNNTIGFNNNVRLFNFFLKNNLKTKIVRHTCFYNEFNFFSSEVLKKNIKYDFVLANDLPCLKPALKIKKKINCKLIYDSHEIYNETLNQFFNDTKNPLKTTMFWVIVKIMRFLGSSAENRFIKQVDHFITVGEMLRKYFENTHKYKGIKVVMNCPSLNSNIQKKDLRQLFNIPTDGKICIYQGVLNKGRGLEMLIKAFCHTKDNVFLIIFGEGPLKEQLISMIKTLRISKKIIFLPLIEASKLISYTAGADIGINLLEPINLSKKFALPNKIFEYIHVGIPIISSKTLEMEIIYRKYNLGMLIENSTEKIALAINHLSENNNTTFIENCAKAKLEYNWEQQENELFEILR
jgi:glycosyltransferase involved in cell wall biosynthesis